MRKIILYISIIAIAALGAFSLNHFNSPVGGGTGTLNQLNQFKATTSPFNAITTNIANKDIYAPNSSATSSSFTADTMCLTGDSCITSWSSGSSLTQEQVEDFAGALVASSSGTHTRLTVTYQDATGDIDFVVDPNLSNYTDDLTHTTDTSANTICSGTGNYLDGEGNCDALVTNTTLTEEEVEDFIGGMLGGTETLISVTYQDGTNDIDFVVNEASIDHDALTNFASGEHFLQSAITAVGTIASGIWNGTAIDIGTYTNLTCGTNCTLTGDEISVDDVFPVLAGETDYTGTHDFDGATLAGLRYFPSFTYASTTFTGTSTIPLGVAYNAQTWAGVKCFTDTGTVNVSFNDGSNRMDAINASTTVGSVTLSTNNSFTAGEKRYVDVGTPASSVTKVSCTIDYQDD